MTDIVNTLRQRHHNVTGGNPLMEPIEGPTIFSEAADEIVRLRAERDEARRECLELLAALGLTPTERAAVCGWECFKEDGE